MWSFLKLTLFAGWRVQSTRVVLVLTLLAVIIAWLAGSFSLRQPQTVAFDIGFSLIRLLAALMALFWIQEMVSKDLERKTVVWACANPVSRGEYVLGKYLGIAAMSVLVIALMGGALWLILGRVAPHVHQAIPLASGSSMFLSFFFLWLDILVITAFGILMALVSTTALLPIFLGAIFAIVARGLGPTLAYVNSADAAAGIWAPFLSILQWVIPDLSRYDIRGVLLYGKVLDEGLPWALVSQSLAYVAVILSVAVYAFSRREFD